MAPVTQILNLADLLLIGSSLKKEKLKIVQKIQERARAQKWVN